MVYLILLYIFPVISESVIPNSLGSYISIRYINIQFCVISVSVISDSVILVSIISDSYLVISDLLYLIPLYQNPLYQIHCGRLPLIYRKQAMFTNREVSALEVINGSPLMSEL